MRASIDQLSEQTADRAQIIGQVTELSVESLQGVKEACQRFKEMAVPAATSAPLNREGVLRDLSAGDDGGRGTREA